MQKKLLGMFLGVSLFLVIILSIYIIKNSVREDIIKKEVAGQRIEYYTRNYFRSLEDIKIDTATEQIALSISFIPEVGSYPIKEEIFQNIAYHALQITTFFPEVNKFNYIVLWDDNTKQKTLDLTIDEDAINGLSDT